MNYITATSLRTKSRELIETLKQGESVSLIYRSKVVAEITPKKESKPLTKTDIKKLQKLAEEFNLPKLSYKERERRYRKHLMEKYGQSLS